MLHQFGPSFSSGNGEGSLLEWLCVRQPMENALIFDIERLDAKAQVFYDDPLLNAYRNRQQAYGQVTSEQAELPPAALPQAKPAAKTKRETVDGPLSTLHHQPAHALQEGEVAMIRSLKKAMLKDDDSTLIQRMMGWLKDFDHTLKTDWPENLSDPIAFKGHTLF